MAGFVHPGPELEPEPALGPGLVERVPVAAQRAEPADGHGVELAELVELGVVAEEPLGAVAPVYK